MDTCNSSNAMGYCGNLGYPWRDLTPSLKECYLDGRDMDEADLDPELKEIAETIIKNTRREIYVLENSCWCGILTDSRVSDRVRRICDRTEILRLAVSKGNLIFLDRQDFQGDIENELTKYLGVYLPSIVTCRQLNVLRAHFGYLRGMAEAIDKSARAAAKKFIFLCNPTYHDNVLCDALYLMTDAIDMACKHGAASHLARVHDSCVQRANFLRNFDRSEYAILVSNGEGFPPGLKGCFHSLRFAFINNAEFEFYFIHGAESSLAPRPLAYPPIIFWAPNCNCFYRASGVWNTLMSYFGISFYDSMPESGSLSYLWFGSNFFDGKGRFAGSWNSEFISRDAVIDLYRALPHSSCMLLHNRFYYMKDIIEATGAKTVVLLRDPRDAVFRKMTYNSGGLLRYFNGDPQKEFEHWLPSKRNLQNETRCLLEIKDNPNVIFIKFEDIDKNPIETYSGLVDDLFPDDPVFVEESLSEKIAKSVTESLPENVLRYQILDDAADSLGLPSFPHGAVGIWKNYFTEPMKEFFKENSNNFLQAFGYEKDDN